MDAALPSLLRNAVALLSLVGSAAAAFCVVPSGWWRQLEQPTTRAAAAMLVVLPAILALRQLGARGRQWERGLLAVFLAAMPLVYLESGVRNEAGSWLLVEGAGLLIFGAWAWLAYRSDAAWLALGIAAHGLLWDAWHHASPYMPAWYARACLIVDLGLALYVLLQREQLRLSPHPPPAASSEQALPALDAQAAAIRADMLRDLATTLRTLQREYDGLRESGDTNAAPRRELYAAGLPNVRVLLTRLHLLLPSLKLGRAVMPDMTAQQQLRRAIAEQAERELRELGGDGALAHHCEVFAQAVDAVLEAARHGLGEQADKQPTLPAIDALGECVDRAMHATQLLQLTLAQP